MAEPAEKYVGGSTTEGASGRIGVADYTQEEDIVKRVWHGYYHAKETTDAWRKKGIELYDLIAGDQWDDIDKLKMQEELRPFVTFNLVEKYVNAVSGLQKGSPQKVEYYPREVSDSEGSDLLTNVAEWARNKADAEEEEAEAFFDLLVTGMGWTETYLDTENNPEGDISVRVIDPLSMYWDPNSRKRNIEDARWILRVKPVTRNDLRDFLASLGKEEMFEYLVQSPDPSPVESFYPQHDTQNAITEGLYQDEVGDSQNRQKWQLALMEYQFYEYEWRYKVTTGQGKSREFTQEQFMQAAQMLAMNGVPFEHQRYRKRIYYRAFVLGRNLIEVEESPYPEGFTYKCMTGKRDRNNNTFYGLVHTLEEPQKWINKFFSQILHIINTNAKGGAIGKEEAFDNPSKAEREWSRPDSIIWADELYDERGNPNIIPKPMSPYPQGTDRLMAFTMQIFPEISGINMEILGLANREQAGVVEAQRKQSSMTMLQWAFTAFRRYIREHGRLLAYYIREYISDGRIVRIDSELGPQHVKLLREQMHLDYDIIVDEAPSSTNQKERTWMVLGQIIPAAAKMGVPVPPDILDYAPIPASLAKKWREYIQQQSQGQEQQQQAAQNLAQAMQEAEVAEKQSEAEENQSQSVLNLAKARETAASTGKKLAGE